MKRVLVLGNSQLVVYKFRKELIKRLVDEKYEVYVSFPNGPFGEGEEISKENGCIFVKTKINRRSKNIFADLILFFRYIFILKKIKPDIVLGYTAKPNIYGGIACRFFKIPFIANITGLGSGLANKGLTQKIMIYLYKIALKNSKCVFFQNIGDKEFFELNNITSTQGCLIPGSGVNLEEFKALEYPKKDNVIRFSYIARVMKAKGIDQYLEAAKSIKSRYKGVEFHILGYCEENYKNILKLEQEEGNIIYHGLVDDIRQHQSISNCTVLPTYHPEGISNVLLEAAACARPIITTDRIGCKETVVNEKTGYLIKEKDSNDLIYKIEKFISLSLKDKEKMGKLGREKIEKEFDREIVVSKYMEVISKI